MKKVLRGDELYKKAQELGVSLQELGHADGTDSEPELQRRVLEAERARRESRLWVIALISAIASAFSALAAWMSVYRAGHP
jgi:hypothetical protein